MITWIVNAEDLVDENGMKVGPLVDTIYSLRPSSWIEVTVAVDNFDQAEILNRYAVPVSQFILLRELSLLKTPYYQVKATESGFTVDKAR